jgi:hypothetical protein
VIAVANGMGEALHVAPRPSAAAVAEAVLAEVRGAGREADAPMPTPGAAGNEPAVSGPRAWRDRGQDLRLEGLVGNGVVPGREHPLGTVIAWTRDHVFPAAPVTEMVAVHVDTGGQFFGQVAMGERTGVGERVELVPRVLHRGGGMVQYFWKAKACR